MIRLINRALLSEGGAAGHLSHLSDNRDLTFSELKEVLRAAAEGKLESVSEKLDGLNLVFTWDVSQGDLRTARNGSDIKGGGMDAGALATKFRDRGNVAVAFNSAFKVLRDALSAVPDNVKRQAFGPAGNTWYSLEIIYAADPNTINYDSNNVVFHGFPVFQVAKDGSVSQRNDAPFINVLTSYISKMQKAVSLKDWKVRGPAMLRLQKLSDGSILQKAIADINKAQSLAGVADSATINDYLSSLIQDELQQRFKKVSSNVAEAIIARCLGVDGAPTVVQIKKLAPSIGPQIADFVRENPERIKKLMLPIDVAINAFAIEILRGLHSTLVNDSNAEVARLRDEVAKAINAIKASGNEEAMDILRTQMQRLGSVDNVAAAMEGIVFRYKGQAYKFTGAFAPAHQILSLFKYGRKGIKLNKNESLHQRLTSLITESGRAFPETQPVTLSSLKQVWDQLERDVEALGITQITPIGSTWKKDPMGDVDLAVSFSGTREQLFTKAEKQFGSARKIGSNIVSIAYPMPDGTVGQIDLMIGNANFVAWSRFSPSSRLTDTDYSPVKGVVRNILLNVITRFAAELDFPNKQSKLDRHRHVVDFDRGLYRTHQTRRGKMGPVKAWKTVNSEFVSDDPDEVASLLFDKNVTATSVRRFEDVVNVLRASRRLSGLADDILGTFVEELHEFYQKNPTGLGDDPQSTLTYVEKIALG